MTTRQAATARFWQHPLLRYIGVYKWRYLIGLCALLAASFITMLPPFVLRDGVDAIARGTTWRELAGFGAIILGLAAVESLLRFLSRLYVSGTAYLVQYRLRNDLGDHLMRLDQAFYVRSRTGDLMSRGTQDLQWVRDFTGPTLMDIIRTIVMMILGAIFLLRIDVRLALIAMAYLPFVAGSVAYFETEVERRYLRVTQQFGELANRVQESISGIRAVKAHALEDTEVAWFTRDNEEMMGRAMRLARYTSGLFPVMNLATGLTLALVVWFGGHDVVNGRITIGEFVQFNAYLALLASQLSSVGWIIASYQQGTVSLKRVTEILNTQPTIVDPEEGRAPSQIRGEIEYHGVTAGFANAPVLEQIDLSIPAGATVAVIGATGSGKTTLVGLLVRLMDPIEGAVLVDGIDVREWPLEELRGAVGFVPQESFLFSDSLRDNVGFGVANPTAAALELAVETSQLSNDLEQFPNRLETVIGERGVTLSGGQKQRAALARALVKDPPILVLDDALSHVDTHTEEEILHRLRDFMARRTTIVIAHRTSTLQSADFIVALEDGRIGETGTHDELIAHDGVYARLYQRQQLAERLEHLGTDVEAEVLESELEAEETR